MTAKSFSRGWPIIYFKNKWVYKDDMKPLDEHRPCRRCERPPTKDGHDACLGEIPGITSACCGHGVEEPFVIKADKEF